MRGARVELRLPIEPRGAFDLEHSRQRTDDALVQRGSERREVHDPVHAGDGQERQEHDGAVGLEAHVPEAGLQVAGDLDDPLGATTSDREVPRGVDGGVSRVDLESGPHQREGAQGDVEGQRGAEPRGKIHPLGRDAETADRQVEGVGPDRDLELGHLEAERSRPDVDVRPEVTQRIREKGRAQLGERAQEELNRVALRLDREAGEQRDRYVHRDRVGQEHRALNPDGDAPEEAEARLQAQFADLRDTLQAQDVVGQLAQPPIEAALERPVDGSKRGGRDHHTSPGSDLHAAQGNLAAQHRGLQRHVHHQMAGPEAGVGEPQDVPSQVRRQHLTGPIQELLHQGAGDPDATQVEPSRFPANALEQDLRRSNPPANVDARILDALDREPCTEELDRAPDGELAQPHPGAPNQPLRDVSKAALEEREQSPRIESNIEAAIRVFELEPGQSLPEVLGQRDRRAHRKTSAYSGRSPGAREDDLDVVDGYVARHRSNLVDRHVGVRPRHPLGQPIARCLESGSPRGLRDPRIVDAEAPGGVELPTDMDFVERCSAAEANRRMPAYLAIGEPWPASRSSVDFDREQLVDVEHLGELALGGSGDGLDQGPFQLPANVRGLGLARGDPQRDRVGARNPRFPSDVDPQPSGFDVHRSVHDVQIERLGQLEEAPATRRGLARSVAVEQGPLERLRVDAQSRCDTAGRKAWPDAGHRPGRIVLDVQLQPPNRDAGRPPAPRNSHVAHAGARLDRDAVGRDPGNSQHQLGLVGSVHR